MLWSFENQIRIFINVNMSAKQLERKTFCGVVMALLKETGFPAGQLCLELTERCRSMPVSVMEEKTVVPQTTWSETCNG